MARARTVKVGQDSAVAVEGFAEFRKALNAMDRSLGRELGKVNKAAVDVIVQDAKQRGQSQGRMGRRVAATIKASASQANAAVVLGGAKTPFAFGAEFGAKKWAQFPPWRGNQWSPDGGANVGYMLHPAVRATRDEFMDIYAKELDQLMAKAFGGD